MDIIRVWSKKYRRYMEYEAYTPEEAKEKGIEYKPWREGQEGDWVLTDDGWVVQVLKTYGPKGGIIRTPGCTAVRNNEDSTMLKRTKNPSIIGGEARDHIVKITQKHKNFVYAYLMTFDPVEAYMKAYGPKSRGYAYMRAKKLLNDPKIEELILVSIKDIASKIGITEEYVLEEMKKLQENTDNEYVKHGVLKDFAKMLGMFEQTKVKSEDVVEGEVIDIEELKKLKVKRTVEIEAPKSRVVVYGQLQKEKDKELAESTGGAQELEEK